MRCSSPRRSGDPLAPRTPSYDASDRRSRVVDRFLWDAHHRARDVKRLSLFQLSGDFNLDGVHMRTAGPEGCEVRACETKLETSSADRPHAQGRAAADRRQLLCTTGCADFFEVTP